MSTTAPAVHRTTLADYEAAQVRTIAAWKSESPDALHELWRRLTVPVARAVEKVVPRRVVRHAITWSYDASGWIASHHEVKRRAGVNDLAELRNRPLADCDRLAMETGAVAEALAAVEGAATGAGGVLTTMLDVPLLFILGLATVRKIGHCYGYPLEHHKDRHFVLGVMIAGMAGSLTLRRERINRLRELEDLLIEETQEDVLADEALSLLFQLELFEEIPGVGAISGALLNWLFMRQVEETARMVFQERWLRDNGKVEVIEPVEAPAWRLARGWSGALNRAAISSGYLLGYGAAFPVYTVAALLRPLNPARKSSPDGRPARPATATT